MSITEPSPSNANVSMVESLNNTNQRLEKECQLLLAQLHQVQEELERSHLINQQNEKRLNELAKTDQAITTIRRSPIMRLIYKATDKLGLTMKEQIDAVEVSGLFDRKWYLQQYPDVMKAGMDPIKHYLRFGAMENRNPGPQFETGWYLKTYPDVADSKINPLLHYIRFGKKEGRQTKRGRMQTADSSRNSLTNSYIAERKLLIQARDELSRLAKERSTQIAELTKARDLAVNQAEKRAAQIAELTKARDLAIGQAEKRAAQIAELTKARDLAIGQAEKRAAQIAELTKARDLAIGLAESRATQIERQRERTTKLGEEHSKQIEELIRAREQAVVLAETRAAQIETLNQARNSAIKQVEQIKSAVESANKENAELTLFRDAQVKLINELKQELFDAKQTASLSVKLQTLREADLKDLQIRYQASLAKQEEQYQLLTKLGERLGAASNYFHQIAGSSTELSSAIIAKPRSSKPIPQARTTRKATKKTSGGV